MPMCVSASIYFPGLLPPFQGTQSVSPASRCTAAGLGGCPAAAAAASAARTEAEKTTQTAVAVGKPWLERTTNLGERPTTLQVRC